MKNFFLTCKEVKIEPTIPKTYYGCFYLGPFRDSQALTVANGLRRTLLTDISGLAITSVKIDGVNHEYSVLKGIRETTMDILLNLKDIVLNKNFKTPLKETQFGYLHARGPGVIRAKDLKLPPMLQSVNPDQYIATLSHDGELILTFTIDEGKNFIFRKKYENFFQDREIQNSSTNNFLEIDSIFTPIKKVNYVIESYGSEAIYTKNQIVILEIWTNGSILPKEALSQALNSLNILFTELGKLKVLDSMLTTYSLVKNKKFKQNIEMFDQNLTFLNFNFHKKRKFKNKSQSLALAQTQILQNSSVIEIAENSTKKILDGNVIELALPFRIFNLLYKSKIFKIDELLKLNQAELKKVLNFDDQLFNILIDVLTIKGLKLK